MDYYKNQSGEVFAFSDIQKVPDNLVAMTPEEVQAHLNPPVDLARVAANVRADRDARIESVRWHIERHSDELALGREPTEPLEPLLQYVQLLRDVPQQAGFPESVEWPDVPDWLEVKND